MELILNDLKRLLNYIHLATMRGLETVPMIWECVIMVSTGVQGVTQVLSARHHERRVYGTLWFFVRTDSASVWFASTCVTIVPPIPISYIYVCTYLKIRSGS